MRSASIAVAAMLLLPLSGSAAIPSAAIPSAAVVPPGTTTGGHSWIVIYRPGALSADGSTSGTLQLDSAIGRAAARTRALAADRATDRLARTGGFRVSNRFRYALQGFSAQLTTAQVDGLLDDPAVARVVPDTPVSVAADTLPTGVRRVNGSGTEPSAGADVDIDVAVIDTGIGPVGGPTGSNAELDIAGGMDCRTKRTGAWTDGHGHGTHVAGTIGARDNGVGVVGVAPGARLWSVRVFDSSGNGSTSSVICGIDWVADWMAQHPGSPMIANMSLRGQDDYRGPRHCDANGRDNRDPEHQAICAATRAGALFVVAAGNEDDDTDDYIPARYDEVITVAAISDFDGAPGGLSSAKAISDCLPPSGPARDDAYAPYSNYGAAVDIVAPGTCIRSLAPGTGSGVRTAIMSGTSMATPHVTGALARYLAAHPATTPAEARARLIASGSLAWASGTDPERTGHPSWPLLRLVDAAALNATAPALTVWPSLASVPVGAGVRHVTVPFDLQRAGGLDGAVDLGLAGLPTGATVTDATALTGLTGLRGSFDLSIADTIAAGDHAVELTSSAATGGDDAVVTLRVDRVAPVIGAPWPRLTIRSGGGYDGSVPVRVAWSVTDDSSGLAAVELQRHLSSWKRLLRGAALQSASVHLDKGVVTGFRVQATDRAGNVRTSSPVTARVAVRDSNSPQVRWQGEWRTRESAKALGRSLRTSTRAGAAATLAFSGRGVAIVAPTGSGLGTLDIAIDGRPVGSVDLGGRPTKARRIVFASAPLAAGDHTIRVTARNASAAVDGFLILQ